ncbi:MAG TPA: hypothetical protein DCP92_06295 [Nitrospiraceae bacterium]|jgi:hypothetical protein|nr:hypothetical protein [Nitrospiraceae bacterium]
MAVQDKIDVRQYCDTVLRELSEMKTKLFDIVCKVESTTAAEEARKAEYFDLFDIVDHLEKKLALLEKDCPLDWRETRMEIESGRKKLDDEINWWYG